MNVLPASTLISKALRDLERTARDAGNGPTMRAMNGAAGELLKGAEILIDPSSGDLLIPSRTTSQTHRVRSDLGCSCTAGQNGKICWHSALAEGIALARDRQVADLDTDAEPPHFATDDAALAYLESACEDDRRVFFAAERAALAADDSYATTLREIDELYA